MTNGSCEKFVGCFGAVEVSVWESDFLGANAFCASTVGATRATKTKPRDQKRRFVSIPMRFVGHQFRRVREHGKARRTSVVSNFETLLFVTSWCYRQELCSAGHRQTPVSY